MPTSLSNQLEALSEIEASKKPEGKTFEAQDQLEGTLWQQEHHFDALLNRNVKKPLEAYMKTLEKDHEEEKSGIHQGQLEEQTPGVKKKGGLFSGTKEGFLSFLRDPKSNSGNSKK